MFQIHILFSRRRALIPSTFAELYPQQLFQNISHSLAGIEIHAMTHVIIQRPQRHIITT